MDGSLRRCNGGVVVLKAGKGYLALVVGKGGNSGKTGKSVKSPNASIL